MERKEQIRVGLIGFGEIGSTLGRGLRAGGLEHVVAYDKYAFDGPFSELIQRRAAECGVELVRSPQELASRADCIISATPGSSSIKSAEAFASLLRPQHLIVDIASATPQVKQQVAERLAASGASFVDGSIVGTPADGVAMPILVAGIHAERVRDTLVPCGMRMEFVSERIGDASAIKILRSVVMKGLEALLLECMLGARRYGLEAPVLASLEKTLSKPFSRVVNGMLATNAIHSARRSEEADMSAETLENVGLDPFVTRAVAERLRWVTGLGMKAHFGGVVPKDYEEALAAIETKIAPADSLAR
ncbi:MAG: phosphogluconate dehydrogenase [Rubritepida sp.]|nr:phosphogluconate dehydrogenase [Rubritepida sp.]